jgi:hypothetical protein
MAARPRRTKAVKALLLAFWNADGDRGRKLELEYFLSQHGVRICLLTETHLIQGDVFRLANYVCHRTDRPTEGGGTPILVRRGIDHYAIPVLVLIQLKATAIHIMLATFPVKVFALYHPLSRPLIGSEFYACFGGGFPS